MNWTCEQTELRLSDYLDGLLAPAEKHDFDAHVNACARCTPLVSSVMHALTSLHALPEIEPSPRLVYNILDSTLGPRDAVTGWTRAMAWFRGLASPRIAYGAVSLCATFLMLATATGFSWKKPRAADLSPVSMYRNADRQAHLVYARGSKYVSDMRVVYEIQSRLRQDEQLPNPQENSAPQASPDKDPGRTDGTSPSSPKQQNRANDLSSHIQVLAAECPVWFEGRMR